MAGALGRLFAELRRRRVVRVLVVYAVAGWLVIQVAATVMPGLHLPEWSVTLVIALVVLGLPIALAMAWMFDAGPKGIERTPPMQAERDDPPGSVATPARTDPPQAAPAPSSPSAPAPSTTFAATPAAAPIATPAIPAEPTAEPPARRLHAAVDDGRRTIAVLPFVNMSGDTENEYFSDGIAEEILNLLTQLPQLKVASRTSSFAYKAKDFGIADVARDLGVSTVLEGSVRKAGERVRITAQLIDTGSDSHLWSETYDRELKDVFTIQDDIAHSIVKALRVTLTPQERRAIQSVATSDPEAYDYYLRGRSYMYSMARRDYEHAIRMFEQAIGVDSKYALAYAGMADAYSHLYRYAEATPENVEKANRASDQAVVLDRESAEAHASRGLALLISERYDDAEREFDTAITLNPNLFDAWHYYGLACSSRGDYEKAAKMYARAAEVSPTDFQVPLFLAQTLASLGRKQDEMRVRLGALGTLERHIKLNPHDTRALYFAAQNLYRVGERDKAVQMAEQALKQAQDEPVVLYNVACFYAEQGDQERAIDLLERAVSLGWGDRAWMEHDSDLDPLHGHPRFQALIERIV
ncbi:tetratricopeptide repeat protein [Lysobacter sp. A6]|uniref:Tetratricopeptide repeat protein n=1 Tax=Noviluteimonas lactosilytica TaxID=2888523 RepID=A0ABS8JH26_9GAMM|nr:tetratricopeptide repeat protein [Lysobacter lactosilyticus]MCC8362911.1 tetratricopeptide repeat protein [Lysobacter lactosilyticus]